MRCARGEGDSIRTKKRMRVCVLWLWKVGLKSALNRDKNPCSHSRISAARRGALRQRGLSGGARRGDARTARLIEALHFGLN